MDFSKLLHFFQEKPPVLPGESEYNAKFCKTLMTVSSAKGASIWQLDSKNQLHPIYGTNFSREELRNFILREGEGIGGAVVKSRQTICASPLLGDTRHDRRVDKAIGFRTRSMISAPILYGGQLYGVLNILNHTSGKDFPLECQTKLSTAGVMYATALAAAGRLLLYDQSSIQSGFGNRKVAQSTEFKTNIVGTSCAIQGVLQMCMKAARSDLPVLILGETGTGKELVARRIHESGNRASGPFIDINCAAFNEDVLESELFGHVKGAYTGAIDNRKGKFLAASGGTLFLDEIGNMSPTFQAKILRVSQEKSFFPVGSEEEVTSDFRIIAATNVDLRKMVKKGNFRKDLFFRLRLNEIKMPLLRERYEDIPLLIQYFLNRFSAKQKEKNPSYQAPKISNEVMEMLMADTWEGNVRELQNAVEVSIANCETDEIQSDDLPAWFPKGMCTGEKESILQQGEKSSPTVEEPSSSGKFSYEYRLTFVKALQATKFRHRPNIKKASELTNIARRTFANHAKEMGLIP